MQDDDRAAKLAAIRQKMARDYAGFRSVRDEVNSTITQATEGLEEITDEQEQALHARYRSGKAGPVLKDLQGRVDRGEVSWSDITGGKADPPELTQQYLASQKKLGRLFKAAGDGRNMDEFLAEEHAAGRYYSALARAENARAKAAGKPVDTGGPDGSGDELGDRETWMARRSDRQR